MTLGSPAGASRVGCSPERLRRARQHRPGVLCPAGMRGGARYPWDASPVDYEGEWSMQLVRSCERDVHVVEGRA
uniref:Uncharacterized protein n=1 Tax=Physcomitrium patens TaxID=3218 RepID=A0A7I4AF53_PHYPA